MRERLQTGLESGVAGLSRAGQRRVLSHSQQPRDGPGWSPAGGGSATPREGGRAGGREGEIIGWQH